MAATGRQRGSRLESWAGIGAEEQWISVGMGGRLDGTTGDEEVDMRERRGLACRTLRGVGTEW